MKKKVVFVLMFVAVALCMQNNYAQLYSRSQIVEDIDSLTTILKRSHPTFDEYYKESGLENKIKKIKTAVNDSMTALDLFRLMQSVVSIDGHTSLQYGGKIYPAMDSPFFPLKIIVYEGKIYVKENLSPDKNIEKGAIIDSINGSSANDVLAKITKFIPGERHESKLRSLENNFHVYYRLVFGNYSSFNVTVSTVKKDFKRINLHGIKNSRFTEVKQQPFDLQFPNKNTAYLIIRGFRSPKQFTAFIDSSFYEIKNSGATNLIIDNRRGGGFSDLADSLLSYFTDKPYRQYEKKITRISSFTEDYIEENKSNGALSGNYFVTEPQLIKRIKRKNSFNGRVILITSPLAYSTATLFAALVKCYSSAVVIGEETGQPLISNGDINAFRLPNTKLTCVTSLSKIFLPCNNGDSIHGVVPHHIIKPSLSDLLNDKDVYLEYAIHLIN